LGGLAFGALDKCGDAENDGHEKARREMVDTSSVFTSCIFTSCNLGKIFLRL